MTQQSRMLLIAAVLSIGGVSALMYMANRYAEVLKEQPASHSARPTRTVAPGSPGREAWKREAAARALAQVDLFIDVRSRIRAEIDRRGGTVPGSDAFAKVRANALTTSGMDLAQYGTVRESFRSWRRGQLAASHAMTQAFEQRKSELDPLDLGDYESLDS